MKSSQFLSAFSTLALAFLFTLAVSTATAGTTGNGWSQQPTVDTRILVTAVDATAGTIAFEFMKDKTTHTYKIDANTKIRVGDNMGTLAQVQVGQQVNKYWAWDKDPQTLGAIVVGPAQPAPAPPPAPTKPAAPTNP